MTSLLASLRGRLLEFGDRSCPIFRAFPLVDFNVNQSERRILSRGLVFATTAGSRRCLFEQETNLFL